MKKRILIKLTLTLLVAVITSSFTYNNETSNLEEKTPVLNNKKTDQTSYEIVIAFTPSMTHLEITTALRCIESSFNARIISREQCPSAPNIEILRFANTIFTTTVGIDDDSEAISLPPGATLPNVIDENSIYEAMNTCNVFLFSHTSLMPCEAYANFQIGF